MKTKSASAGVTKEPHVSRRADAKFEAHDDIRPWLAFRDLGLVEATGGAYIGWVSKPSELGHRTGHHHHKWDFQFIYVLKGWVKFQYNKTEEVTLKEGDCVYQPPELVHNLVDYSEDLELLELMAPARIDTVDV